MAHIAAYRLDALLLLMLLMSVTDVERIACRSRDHRSTNGLLFLGVVTTGPGGPGRDEVAGAIKLMFGMAMTAVIEP